MKASLWKFFAICILAGLCGFGVSSAGADQMAAVVNAAPDFSSGTHSVIQVNPTGGPRPFQNDLSPTVSDLSVSAYGKYFYRIERYLADRVTKFDIVNPATAVWQYSTLDDGETVSSNPQAMVFASDRKAYLPRYEKTKAWIVDPSAASQKDFKIGELDLGIYADADGVPEMGEGIIVDGKLFLLIQRMDQSNNWAPGTAYVAVFDISTDKEINTGRSGTQGLNGIKLPASNPNVIQYLAETGMIYIGCQGRTENTWAGTPPEFTGGIVQLDPHSYETKILVDDGDDQDHPYGNFINMVVNSETKGYFIGYAQWGDNTIYAFNPSTGNVTGAVAAGLANKNLTELKIDENGYLWVANATDAGVNIIDTTDDSVDEFVGTSLNPQAIAFADDSLHTYYLPYLISDANFKTGLAIRNLDGEDSATVTVIGYDSAGDTIYSQSQVIAPSGQVNFIVGRDLDLKGWLKVEATRELGGLSFIATTNPVPYMADMSFIGELSQSLLIPHVAQTEAYWDTTVYICNPNTAAATVTLRFTAQDGSEEFTKSYQASPMGSLEVALKDLLGDTDRRSGSVEISANKGVGAFALYENRKAGGYYFSGISAVNLP